MAVPTREINFQGGGGDDRRTSCDEWGTLVNALHRECRSSWMVTLVTYGWFKLATNKSLPVKKISGDPFMSRPSRRGGRKGGKLFELKVEPYAIPRPKGVIRRFRNHFSPRPNDHRTKINLRRRTRDRERCEKSINFLISSPLGRS